MAPNVGFKMHFPKLKKGDEIFIKGTLKKIRNCISFNFLDHHGKNVIFHFKTIFVSDDVILNTKEDYSWMREVWCENKWKAISDKGAFDFRFHFYEDSIRVYAPGGTMDYEYTIPEDSELTIGHIERVEIWDDLGKVKECVFKYFGEDSK